MFPHTQTHTWMQTLDPIPDYFHNPTPTPTAHRNQREAVIIDRENVRKYGYYLQNVRVNLF